MNFDVNAALLSVSVYIRELEGFGKEILSMEESFEGNVWFDWRSRRVNGVGIL